MKVIPLFVTNLVDGGTVPLYGDGGNVPDWLHFDDHCRTLHLVLEGGQPGEVYNIGGGTELTNSELTGLLLEATGPAGTGSSWCRTGWATAPLDGVDQDPHRARLRASHPLRAGPRRHRRVVPHPPHLVGAPQARLRVA